MVEPKKLKVVELRQELAKLGLPQAGLKGELVARLEEALAASQAPAPAEPEPAASAGAKRKRKAAAEPSAARPPEVYNVLRDRPRIEAVARALAEEMLKKATAKMTAMAFCVEVLRRLNLHDVAIGQAERIFISGVRKAALGARDAELIVKPNPAAPVEVPTLDSIADSITTEGGDGGGGGDAAACSAAAAEASFLARLRSRLDADSLRAHSVEHLKSFLTPDEVGAVAQSLTKGVAASSERATALRESSGTGRNGAYGDVNQGKAPLLKGLCAALKQEIQAALGSDALGDKVLVTR